MAKGSKRSSKPASNPVLIAPRGKGVFGAAIYARVSTGEQTHDSQLGALREYCERRGWTVVAEVLDCAGGATQRPRRDELIAAARRKELDAIVVYKLDRWGRSTVDLISTLQELDAVGCTFVSITDSIDMSTPSGRALAGMLSVFAAFERDLIRERVNAGLAAAKAKGVRLGRPAKAKEHADEVRRLKGEGKTQREIAEAVGIGNGSVARILADAST